MKTRNYHLLILSSFCILCHLLGEAVRTKNKIYISIDGRSSCFRRLNATHQIGCTSEPNGNVGVVHHISTEDDLNWLLNKGPHAPYAALMHSTYFKMDNVQRLKNSGKINGIMVIHLLENKTLTEIPPSFSPDKSCPLEEYGMYQGTNYSGCQSIKWNKEGQGMMFEDFDFPIFILTNQTEVELIIEECYRKFNQPDPNGNPRDYPLCAVELKDRMDAAKDSETCIRRTNHQQNLNPDKYCDPLGDLNVYATIKAVNNTSDYPVKSVIVAAARMDSFSMFDNVYPSADNHVSGIVALLAAAEAIGKFKDKIKGNVLSKDILFTFLNGEAFDYIGSSRLVYDMQRNQFPLPLSGAAYLHPVTLDHISHFVEVNQLAYRDDNKLWIHTDPISRKNISVEIDTMIKTLKDCGNSSEVGIEEVNNSQPLPPASVQSFLKEKLSIPAVVISDHQREFTNKYYNSRFDLVSQINASYPDSVNKSDWYDYVTVQAKELTKVSTMLARFLYNLSMADSPPDDLNASEKSVTHMLYCFLVSPQCELFREILTADFSKDLSAAPYPFYVGVTIVNNHITALIEKLLGLYVGDKMDNYTSDSCVQPSSDKVYQYMWMQGPLIQNSTSRDGKCIRTTSNTSLAVSPAFTADGNIDENNWRSGRYSAWAESSWAADAISIRLFLIPNPKLEIVTLVIGMVILILSFILCFIFNKKASVIFANNVAENSSITTSHVPS
ncbi:hypothetical protein ACJMK2_025758 [Sinanodonta woodiana]|uniref:Nicastrin n=1 Tax=Sinanodonta woodiana TaxID=1069815 RepID=A0ABD3XKY9_SINWO